MGKNAQEQEFLQRAHRALTLLSDGAWHSAVALFPHDPWMPITTRNTLLWRLGRLGFVEEKRTRRRATTELPKGIEDRWVLDWIHGEGIFHQFRDVAPAIEPDRALAQLRADTISDVAAGVKRLEAKLDLILRRLG